MSTPTLSIAIATRNRTEYVSSFLHGVLNSKSSDFEVVISDNSDSTEFGIVVDKIGDTRVLWSHTTDSLNMHGNLDRACGLARGEFVILLGDDDGLMVDEAITELSQIGDAEALLSDLIMFSWPGVRHRLWGDISGYAYRVPLTRERSYGVISASEARSERLRGGGAGGLGFLPRVYQGFVRRSTLQKLFDLHGTLFPGASPDMANAIALTYVLDNVVYSDLPLVIAGHGPSSAGALASAGMHHSTLERAIHLPGRTIKNWNSKVPRFWSGTTVYAASINDAITQVKGSEAEELTRFNYEALIAHCLIYEPWIYKNEICKAVKANMLDSSGVLRRIFFASVRKAALRLVVLIRATFEHGYRYLSARRHCDITSVMTSDKHH